MRTRTRKQAPRFLAPAVAGLLALAVAFLVFSGRGNAQEQAVSLTKAEVEAAAKQRVLFGHQSVGANILNGVRKLADENNVKLVMMESRGDKGKTPAILQFSVGSNGDPLGKIKDFVSTTPSFANIDIAMVKICYVDLSRNSDAAAVAKSYAGAIKDMQRSHPSTRFIAVTSPLTALQSGAKAWVKNLIRGGSPDLADNAKRKEFNDYLRKEFDKDHLFDLAALEAEQVTAGRRQAGRGPAPVPDGRRRTPQRCRPTPRRFGLYQAPRGAGA